MNQESEGRPTSFAVDSLYVNARERVEESIVGLRRLQLASEQLGATSLAVNIAYVLLALEGLAEFIRNQAD